MTRTATTASKQDGKSTATNLHNLQMLVAQDLRRVDDVILTHVETEVALIGQLARHIIASGGKRLRPVLTLTAAKLCGYTGERHIHLAACVEFIHTATLLHDDVVDESKLRRGNATANELWGNKASVLVGDFLLSRAFQLMVGDGSLKVLKILSDTSAIIAQGEVKQLITANDPKTTEQSYLDVITSKTAALFAAACELGAVVTEKEDKESALRNYGLNLGIAFQLVDDALDYASEQATLGKTVGDDFRDGKITLPVILAYAKGNEEERAFWHRTLEDQQQTDEDLAYATQLLKKHGAIEDTLARARSYAALASSQLHGFDNCPEKAALLETVDFAVQRAY